MRNRIQPFARSRFRHPPVGAGSPCGARPTHPSRRLLLLSLVFLLLFAEALPPAFGACLPDINKDGKVDADDAWILYIVYKTPKEKIGIGRGEVSGGGSPRVSITPAAPTVAEGSPAAFVLTTSQTSSAISVEVKLSATGDFGVSADTRTVEIADGETTATLSVDTVGDSSVETWGTVRAMVECGTGYVIGKPDIASVAIVDDDVTISVAATLTVVERFPAVFILTASEAPQTTFTVEVAVAATGDFGVSAGTRTVEFEAGAITATLGVDTLGDSVDEENGTVTAVVQTGLGYAVGVPATTSVEILDDDVTISIWTQAKSVSEGSDAVFVLTASKAPLTDFTVRIAVTATGSDHGVQAGPRTVEFEAGVTMATLRVETSGNSVDGENGSVTAVLQPGVGYIIGTPIAFVAITDNDVTISIAAQASSVSEGSPAVFVLNASKAPPTAFTVKVAVTAAGGDHGVLAHTRRVEFETGAITATFRVRTQNDDIDEEDGTATAALQAGDGYAVGAPATTSVTILDDDVTISVSIAAKRSSVSEGSGAAFVLTASEAGQTAFTANVAVTARGGDHGVLARTRRVEFEAGAITATFRVRTQNDNVDEENGLVTAALQPGAGYVVGTPATAAVTIEDDDANDVTISIAAQTLSVSAGTPAVFVLTASEAAQSVFTVEVALSVTVAFDAVTGTETTVSIPSRTVQFEAGAMTATLSLEPPDYYVSILGAAHEPGTVTAELLAGDGYGIGSPSTATVVIVDDD